MNLIDDMGHMRARRKPPVWLAVLTLVGLAALYPSLKPHPHSQAALRPLAVEEKEEVVELFSSLEVRVPELSHWTEETLAVFEKDALPAVVDSSRATPGLVQYDGAALRFSPHFFEADPVTQENALVEAIVAINQPGRSERQAEIAVSTGD